MRTSALRTAVLTCVVVGHPPPAAAQVDQQRAQEYFKEAQALCEREAAIGQIAGRVVAVVARHARHRDTLLRQELVDIG